MIRTDNGRLLANAARAKARTCSIGRAAVIRDAYESYIQQIRIRDVGKPHEGSNTRKARRFERIHGHGTGFGELFWLGHNGFGSVRFSAAVLRPLMAVRVGVFSVRQIAWVRGCTQGAPIGLFDARG